MSEQLLPCPFCGSKVHAEQGRVPPAGDITYLLCDGCGAVTSFRPRAFGSLAFAAYNRRAAIQYATHADRQEHAEWKP